MVALKCTFCDVMFFVEALSDDSIILSVIQKRAEIVTQRRSRHDEKGSSH